MPGVGIGISPFFKRLVVISSPPSSTNVTVQAWLDKIGADTLTYPNQAKIDVYTNAFDYADSEGLTTQFDCLGLLKLPTADIIKVPFIHTAGSSARFDYEGVGEPVFTPNVGVKGTGFVYINTNWNPSIHGVNYVAGNSSFGAGKTGILPDPSGYITGIGDNFQDSVAFGQDTGTPPILSGGTVQDNTASYQIAYEDEASEGLMSISLKANLLSLYKNGILLDSIAQTEYAITNDVLIVLSAGNGAGFFTENNATFFYAGSGNIDQSKLNIFFNMLLL